MSLTKTEPRRAHGSAGQHQGAAMKKGWETMKLGELCDIRNGSTPSKGNSSFWDGGNIPWFTIDDMREQGRAISFTRQKITKSALSETSVKLLPADSVLLCCTASVGEFAIARIPLTTNQQFNGLVVKNRNQLDPNFLFHYAATLKDELLGLSGKTTIDFIPISRLRDITVPVPPLPEQQRIVSLLDEAVEGLAAAKANAGKNLQNARALFESHLQSVFTQRGKGWVEKRLDDVCTFSSGGTPSKNNSSYWSGKIPWVSGRDMKSTRLSDSLLHISKSAVDESSTRMAPAGTLLVLVRGMGLAHGAQITELMVPCAFNQDIRGIHPESCLIPRYLLFALRDGVNSSDTVLSNAAHGTLKIDSNELHSVMIRVPPREHQQMIVKTIDSLAEETQRLASLYERKLVALEGLKKSLLHQAFTGAL